MERKPKPNTYIEPMPRKQFLSLMKEFKTSGGKYISNEESEAFLDIQEAEACALNATTILFRRRPTRSAVYEELFHVQQYREGKIDGSIINAYENEIEAQKFLLENAIEFQLTQVEINQTSDMLVWYEENLRKMRGDDKNDNM